jgi:hypothetical protein
MGEAEVKLLSSKQTNERSVSVSVSVHKQALYALLFYTAKCLRQIFHGLTIFIASAARSTAYCIARAESGCHSDGSVVA